MKKIIGILIVAMVAVTLFFSANVIELKNSKDVVEFGVISSFAQGSDTQMHDPGGAGGSITCSGYGIPGQCYKTVICKFSLTVANIVFGSGWTGYQYDYCERPKCN